MRKLLSLVLAFAMILGLFAFPVSADESMYQAVGQELMNYGVLKGVDAQGTLKEMDKLTREESLVVLSRLMGQEDKAMATEAVADFTDVPATHWAAKYVAYAKLQGWTTGVSEKEFGLGQQVTTQQVVTFMMRALGYKEVKWEEAMTKAKELGLLEGVSAMAEDQIIRGEVFIVMKNTLYTKPMNEKQELIYKLGLKENPVPETLEVVDVKADNLLEVVVEFNQELDKDSLKDAFRFVGKTGKLTPELQEDGKTVVLTVDTVLTNLKMYKLQVSGVKTLAGVKMEKVVKEFKAEDKVYPEVVSVVVIGPKDLQVTFSEPVVAGEVKAALNTSKSYSKAKVESADGKIYSRKFNVSTFSLKDGSTYKTHILKFKDAANYPNIEAELEVEYAKVAAAPTVEVVKATQEYVEVKFDRPVKGLSADNFYHTYSSWKALAIYKTMDDMNKNVEAAVKAKAGLTSNITDTEYVDTAVVRFVRDVADLKGSDHPLQVGDVVFNVLAKANGKKVVDKWANQLQDAAITVAITADKDAPVVESVEVTGEDEVVVTFSKKVAADKDNYEFLKEDGSKLTETSLKAAVPEGNTVKLTLSNKKQVGKTVVLNIKGVKDTTINQNKLVATESQTITFGDKTFKGIERVSFIKKETDDIAKLRIEFKEAVDTEKATDKKNYKVKSSGVIKDVDFEMSVITDKIIELTFDHDTWTKKLGQPVNGYTASSLVLVISNEVTDVAGNKMAAFQDEQTVQNGAVAPAVKSIVANSTKEIVITFNQVVETESIGADSFKLVGLTGYAISDATHDEDKITLTLDDAEGKTLLPFDVDSVKVDYQNGKIVGLAGGQYIDGTKPMKTIKVDDKIKPEVANFAKATSPDTLNTDTEYGKTGMFKLAKKTDTHEEYKKVYDAKVKFDKPAVALLWNETTNKFNLVIKYTEDMKQDSFADGTYKLTASEDTSWAIKTRPVVSGKYVVVDLGRPESKDITDETAFAAKFQDVKLVQVQDIKDANGNLFKYDGEIDVVLVQEKKKADLVAVESVEVPALTDIAVNGTLAQYYLENNTATLSSTQTNASAETDGNKVVYQWSVKAPGEEKFKVIANQTTLTLAASEIDTGKVGTYVYKLTATPENAFGIVGTPVEKTKDVVIKAPSVTIDETANLLNATKTTGVVKDKTQIKIKLTGAKFTASKTDLTGVTVAYKAESGPVNTLAANPTVTTEDDNKTLVLEYNTKTATPATNTGERGTYTIRLAKEAFLDQQVFSELTGNDALEFNVVVVD